MRASSSSAPASLNAESACLITEQAKRAEASIDSLMLIFYTPLVLVQYSTLVATCLYPCVRVRHEDEDEDVLQ